MITNHQLVFKIFVSYASPYPQSWQLCSVIFTGNKRGIEPVREKSFLFCLFIYKHDLAKLQLKEKRWINKKQWGTLKLTLFFSERWATVKSSYTVIADFEDTMTYTSNAREMSWREEACCITVHRSEKDNNI